jgi:hypothetical protein
MTFFYDPVCSITIFFLVAAVPVLPQSVAAASWTHASDGVVDLIRPKQTPSFYWVPISDEIS